MDPPLSQADNHSQSFLAPFSTLNFLSWLAVAHPNKHQAPQTALQMAILFPVSVPLSLSVSPDSKWISWIRHLGRKLLRLSNKLCKFQAAQ